MLVLYYCLCHWVAFIWCLPFVNNDAGSDFLLIIKCHGNILLLYFLFCISKASGKYYGMFLWNIVCGKIIAVIVCCKVPAGRALVFTNAQGIYGSYFDMIYSCNTLTPVLSMFLCNPKSSCSLLTLRSKRDLQPDITGHLHYLKMWALELISSNLTFLPLPFSCETNLPCISWFSSLFVEHQEFVSI